MPVSATSRRTPLLQRFANQERRLNEGVRAGTITAAEAAPLRQKLQDAQANFQRDGFDRGGGRRAQQRQALQGLSKEINAAATNEVIDPARRASNIEQRIAKGLEDGSLTAQEAEALKAGLAQARAAMAAAKTPEEQKAVAQQLGALSKQVHTARHNGEMDSAKRTQSFAKRIQAGIADGSLTQREADKLSQQLAGVDAMARNGAPDASQMNRLDRDIFTERHDRQVNPAAATQALSKRLDALQASGAISSEQATAFRAELKKLSAAGARNVGPRLNLLRERLEGIAPASPEAPAGTLV